VVAARLVAADKAPDDARGSWDFFAVENGNCAPRRLARIRAQIRTNGPAKVKEQEIDSIHVDHASNKNIGPPTVFFLIAIAIRVGDAGRGCGTAA
jgi:hypothetical protein